MPFRKYSTGEVLPADEQQTDELEQTRQQTEARRQRDADEHPPITSNSNARPQNR